MTFTPASPPEDLMECIVRSLTAPQRAALVGSLLATRPNAETILIDGNERSVAAMLRHEPPLVRQEGNRRFLSVLGLDIARYLRDTNQYEI